MSSPEPATKIAIVGLACRVPGARNLGEFWRNLCDGRESIVQLSEADLRSAGIDESVFRDPHYVKAAAPLDGVAEFDAPFFGFNPREAAVLDPQHRHFFECAWEALEHAGHDPSRFAGQTGVFAGCGMNAYFQYHLLPNARLMESMGLFLVRHTGNDKDFLATRLSYLLDLRGPSIGVQTACSTSLVAVHLACETLLSGQCDMALAGGVTIELPQRVGYRYEPGEILSPDGHCRAFDAEAAGTVFGSGVGVVVLRRLEDAIRDRDHIYAVIQATAVNNDGSGKVGYLAPSVDGQAQAVDEAISVSGIDAASIGYVETHGTGTAIGDPIEVAALSLAFGKHTDRRQFCAIGSVKTNVGHLDAAAGVVGLIKATMAVHEGVIPASLNYSRPSPAIDFPQTPFYVNVSRKEWPSDSQPRRAAVNALGVGGTNAHCIVEQAPEVPADHGPTQAGRPRPAILPLSAMSNKSLRENARRLAQHLRQGGARLEDVALTLQRGRKQFPLRRCVVADSPLEAALEIEALLAATAEPTPAPSVVDVVFMFPGGGAQYPGMGAGLYDTEPVFRQSLDAVLEIARRHGLPDVSSALRVADPRHGASREFLERPSASILSVFAVEYALARLWMSRGIRPSALIGHSLGEYVAAHLAGVFSLETAVRIVGLRGAIFERSNPGAMASVALSEGQLSEWLRGGISLAAVNAPDLCVVSGGEAQINDFLATMADRGIEAQRLHISTAAHSGLLEPFLSEFHAALKNFEFATPRVPIVSNLTGSWAGDELADPAYWVRHLRQTVRFSAGIATLATDTRAKVCIEVGPGTSLSAFARAHLPPGGPHAVVSSMRHARETATDERMLATAMARLWCAGVEVDWNSVADPAARRVALPTYAWDHGTHWIDASPPAFIAGSPSKGGTAREGLESPMAGVERWLWRHQWSARPLADPGQGTALCVAIVESALDGGAASSLAGLLRARGHRVVTIEAGNAYRAEGDRFVVHYDSAQDWDRLVGDLHSASFKPDRLVHLWPTVVLADAPSPAAGIEASMGAFDALLLSVKAFCSPQRETPIRVVTVTRGACDADDSGVTSPGGALATGPTLTGAREYPGVSGTLLDLDPADADPLRHVVAELEAVAADSVVAIRGNSRRIRSFSQIRTVGEESASLRLGGVYIVTGGASGVGYLVSQHLARSVGARLVIAGRTTLPPRESWADYCRSEPEGHPVRETVENLLALEAVGAEVFYVAADVSRAEEAGRLVEDAEVRFGTLNGVWHVAGVIDDAPIDIKTPESARRVLAPKVYGALALDHAVAHRQLDLFVMFSSVSAALALPGQVDYTSANAFLDAFAAHRRSTRPGRTVSMGWSTWRDTGMVARALGMPRIRAWQLHGPHPRHPLLGRCVERGESRAVYECELHSSRWELEEHQLLDGQRVLPGTAYLDVLWAACRDFLRRDDLALSDLMMLEPLLLAESARCVLQVEVKRSGSGLECVARSIPLERVDGEWTPQGAAWCQHVRANLEAGVSTEPPPDWAPPPMAAPSAPFDSLGLNTRQAASLRFGARWEVLRACGKLDASLYGSLVLPERFVDDLSVPRLHPAMLDVGSALGLALLDDERSEDLLYVPMSIGRLEVLGSIPARCQVRAVRRHGPGLSSELASFDVAFLDDSGRPILRVFDYQMRGVRRLGPAAEAQGVADASGASGQGLSRLRSQGLGARLAMTAMMRVLESPAAGCHVLVSSVALPSLVAEVDAASGLERGSANAGSESTILEFDGFSPSPMERIVGEVWSELLQVRRIGRNDDFFDLGGHSLLAIRSLSRIEKRTGVKLALPVVFEKRRLSELAGFLGGQASEADGSEARRPAAAPVGGGLRRVDRNAYRVSEARLGRQPGEVQKDG